MINKKGPMTIKPLSRAIAASVLSSTLLLSGCGQTTDNSAMISEQLQRGRDYAKQHQYRAAILETKRVIQSNPDDSGGYIFLAKVYNQLGQSKAAVELLQQVNDPSGWDYLLTLAESLIERRKFASAWLLLQRNANLNETHHLQFNLLAGRALNGLGKHSEALAVFDDLLEIDKNNTSVLIEKARVYAIKNDLQKMNNVLVDIIKIDPNHHKANFFKAQAYRNQDDLTHAEDLR